MGDEKQAVNEAPRVSVVAATYNRAQLLRGLLASLGGQTLPADQFEVIVVDDGSSPPAARDLPETPFSLTVIEQANAGPAAARHAGIVRARGPIIVIVDDDMETAPRLLEEHLRMHEAGYTLVLGRIVQRHVQKRAVPLFERFHSGQLERFVAAAQRAPESVHGAQVCTGNVSFRRDDYLRVGGFDTALGRSEDRELGVRLEKAGAKLVFCDGAQTINGSDVSFETWWKRNFFYGVFDLKIARKHPDVKIADPWHFFFDINPVSRLLVMLTVVAPSAGKVLSQAAMTAAHQCDRLGLGRTAIAGATLGYGLEYFRGVRAESGSLRAAVEGLYKHAMARRAVLPKIGQTPIGSVEPDVHQAVETPGYLTVDGTRLYYVHHQSAGPCRGAVLLVGAMALERSHSYLVWVRWARALARAGFDVLRFDFRGVGESEGRFEEMTFGAWDADVHAAYDLLCQLRPNVPIVLHGLRLGALYAGRLFAAGRGDALLAWDPVADAREMLEEILQHKLKNDLAENTGRELATRERLLAELQQGKVVEVEGYPWSRAFWDSSEAWGLPELESVAESRPWRVVSMGAKAPEHGQPNRVWARVSQPTFWRESHDLVPDLNELFTASLELVESSAKSL